MLSQIRLALVLSSSLLLSSCANLSAGNLFSHYSAQNQDMYQAVKSGQYQKAEEELPNQVAGEILDNMEKGRVYFLNAQYEQSKSSLESSDKAVQVQQDKAVISVSDTATNVGSIAVNDNLNIYRPADYELGFLHLYLGLNYLQQNSLEGALVEMRRGNQVQEKARKEREKELESAAKEMQSQGLSPNLGSVLSNYPDAGKQLQAVQNGYLLYLSALLYETANNLNDAWVDYRRALAVMPDNRDVIDGAMRVGRRLGMRQDVSLMEKRYGKHKAMPVGKSRVLFIEEQGVVEAMQSWRLTLPIYDSRDNVGLYSLALPYYPAQPIPTLGRYTIDGQSVSGHLLTDVNLMAQRDLSERIPAMVIRQALRVWAKDRLRKEATKKGDDVGNLIFNVWNTLTEQPDTRSWLTLPGAVLSGSRYVTPGTQTLSVDGKQYQFNVEAGQTALVWISRQGGNATIWHKQLGKL